MIIDQTDIANLPDDSIRRMVLCLTDESLPETPITDFWRRLVVALVRVFRERRCLVADLEYDLLNDDGPGALVEPGTDPVVEALEEMRAGIRRLRGLD